MYYSWFSWLFLFYWKAGAGRVVPFECDRDLTSHFITFPCKLKSILMLTNYLNYFMKKKFVNKHNNWNPSVCRAYLFVRSLSVPIKCRPWRREREPGTPHGPLHIYLCLARAQTAAAPHPPGRTLAQPSAATLLLLLRSIVGDLRTITTQLTSDAHSTKN